MDFLIRDARPHGEIHPVMKMPVGVGAACQPCGFSRTNNLDRGRASRRREAHDRAREGRKPFTRSASGNTREIERRGGLAQTCSTAAVRTRSSLLRASMRLRGPSSHCKGEATRPDLVVSERFADVRFLPLLLSPRRVPEQR
jgi:hypothetical protein